MRPALVALILVAAGAVLLSGHAVLLEAWLIGFLACAGLSVGALGALATGHLLSENWLAPVRVPLEAAARTLPVVALMALPVLAGLEALYPWAGATPPPMPAPRAAWFAPLPFRVRAGAFLAAWAVLALLLARPGGGRRRLAALVLVVLAITVPLAAQDWSLSRDPQWWGSLQGVAVWIDGLAAGLALAALAAILRGEMPSGETGPGEALERALLALGLATLWLWFTQFIVVWMADLPAEAGWYARRTDSAWSLAKLGIAVPALLLALTLAAPPRHRRWRMAAVCVLLLTSHLAHLWWVVRPDAPVAPAPPWLDGAMLLLLGLGWGAWWLAEMRRVSRAEPAEARGRRPATASVH
jgi:hypothetical protein